MRNTRGARARTRQIAIPNRRVRPGAWKGRSRVGRLLLTLSLIGDQPPISDELSKFPMRKWGSTPDKQFFLGGFSPSWLRVYLPASAGYPLALARHSVASQ